MRTRVPRAHVCICAFKVLTPQLRHSIIYSIIITTPTSSVDRSRGSCHFERGKYNIIIEKNAPDHGRDDTISTTSSAQNSRYPRRRCPKVFANIIYMS